MSSVVRPSPLSTPAKAFILDELLPLLESTTFEGCTARGNSGPVGGETNVFGYGMRRFRSYDFYSNNTRHPHLYQKLLEFGNEYVPIPFTAITVNHNFQTKQHIDKHNRGVSYTVSFGDFAGGELMVDGEAHQTNLAPVIFDASVHPHYNLPIQGNRYSLIYFVSGKKQATDEEIAAIQRSLSDTAIRSTANYVVAIPTYNRPEQVVKKTLTTLLNGGVHTSQIYLFVADQEQCDIYSAAVPRIMYHEIVIGQLGIVNQRNYIRTYFPEGTYVVSVDDDIEQLDKLVDGKLQQIHDVHEFFQEAYDVLLERGLYLWGIYPVHNVGWMKNTVTTSLKFVIGCCHGYIVRHSNDLMLNPSAETKEDYELSILHYLKDNGVVRFNNVTVKTRFHCDGGLGKDREARNEKAVAYLKDTYPQLVSERSRKNGFKEIRLSKG
jgi:hypothetical protein